jgi:uncharacterized protein YodC (DUF2158 family)
MAFKKGDVVALKAVVPTGPILSMRMNEDGEVFCLVEWQDLEGDVQQRWFKADELQAVES